MSTWILSPLFSKVQTPNVIVDPPEGRGQPIDLISALSRWSLGDQCLFDNVQGVGGSGMQERH